jgi:hypothetical protein
VFSSYNGIKLEISKSPSISNLSSIFLNDPGQRSNRKGDFENVLNQMLKELVVNLHCAALLQQSKKSAYFGIQDDPVS